MSIDPRKLVFDSSVLWYQSFYASRDISSKVSDIATLLEMKTDDVVLDFGCGIGDITEAVSKRCKSIVGFDISSQMIFQASRNFPSIEFYSYKSDIPHRHFSKGYAFFHVANYVFAQEGIGFFLSEISSFMRIPGRFVFDFWNVDAVSTLGLEVREKGFQIQGRNYTRKVVPNRLDEELVRIDIEISEQSSNTLVQTEYHYLAIPAEVVILDAARKLKLDLQFCDWPSERGSAYPWSRVGIINF